MAQFSPLTLPLLLVLISSAISGVAYASATFKLVNSCQETIWPGILPNGGSQNLSTTGFALPAGESNSVPAPASWGGRIWARTHCTQDSAGRFSCLTGDCGSGKVECAGGNGTSSPVTLAEFQPDSVGAMDFYDVSLVNGFNLPVLVVPLGSGSDCRTTGCTADLIGACPPELRMTGGDGGETVGCKSACEAFGKDEYCCRGDFSSPGACKPTNYSQTFKRACPRAYSYPFDDANSTFSCSGSVYTITFCPPPNASQVPSNSVDATSIIRPGNELNSTSQLISEGGNFTLGFFTIKETNLSYLGIWYTADDQLRRVWVANPNSPIAMINNAAQLTMDNTGSLRIFSGGNLIMNVADQIVINNNTIAVLLDSGNFVLMDSGAGNRTLWQSFDHPTNTLLPGMKLGFNLTTRQNRTLSSWLSNYVPASGAFTLSLERTQDSGQFVIRRRGAIYWTSGSWKNQDFPLLPGLNDPSNQFMYKLNFVSVDDGLYFSFETIGTSIAMLSFFPEGQIVNGENRIISTYGEFCYGYERDNGCVTSAMPNCRSNKDTFQSKKGNFVGDNGNSEPGSNISLSECMEKCWNDCNCNGFATFGNDTGCITWTKNKQFQVDESGSSTTKYVLDATKSSKGKAWIWVVVAVSVVIVSVLLGFICYVKVKKHKAEEEEKRLRDEYIHQLTASGSFKNISEMQRGRREGDLNIFSFSSIVAATNDFSGENKLGEGGFGPVYRGKLLDGREIAVKRLSRTSGQGLVEFKNELILISKLQHTNLVRVLGCCIHEEEKMLIYEFMPNKSLDFFLFAQDKKEQLDWQKRFNIIDGVAQGLLYLHKYSRMRVIHRDLKASNVLLDENMNSKIADFGMARIFKQNETEAMTNRVVGTYGYMSPEYAMEGTFSIKSDVFSFGVLILEIVSGRRNISFHQFDDRSLNLIGYAWDLWREGVAIELKDAALGDNCDIKQLLRCIHVGLLCVQESATDRPTMSEVISMLNNENMTLPAPKQPAFFTGRRAVINLDSTSPETGNQGINLPVSVNDMSISVMEAR